MEYIRRSCKLSFSFCSSVSSVFLATLEEVFAGIHLLFLLLFGLNSGFRQCRTHFRLNGGVGAGFRRNTFSASASSTFLSLYRSLLLALSLLAFHSASLQPLLFLLFFGLVGVFRHLGTNFRLNGGVGAGFRRNTVGVAATSSFLSLYRSLLLALSLLAFTSDFCSFYLALSLPIEWRL
jgi:hypothetical protein